jgi:uridine kinase
LRTVAAGILELTGPGCVRVAVDGVDGAGKTVFADELGAVLAASGRPMIRASVDGFHNPRAIRYRQGRSSPAGFYEDSYDYAALRQLLLDPLGPGGSGRYHTAAFDHRSDRAVDVPEQVAPSGALRPELRSYWDLSIWLAVRVEVSIGRCARRDGSSPDPAVAANQRYVVGQQLYIAAGDPVRHATLVIDNNDLAAPFLVPRQP